MDSNLNKLLEIASSDGEYGEQQKVGRFVFRLTTNSSPTSSTNNSCTVSKPTTISNMLSHILNQLMTLNNNLIQLLDNQTVSYINTVQQHLNKIVSYADECDQVLQLFPVLNNLKSEVLAYIVESSSSCPNWIQQLPTVTAFLYIRHADNDAPITAASLSISFQEVQSFVTYRLMTSSRRHHE